MTLGEWQIWMYASNTRVGTIADNNAARVPLSAFTPSTPASPEWLQLDTIGLYLFDAGEKDTEIRGGGIMVRRGEVRWGGDIVQVQFDFNDSDSIDSLFAFQQGAAKKYVYLWLNDYPYADKIIANPDTHVVRVVLELSKPDSEGNFKTIDCSWRKASREA